MRIQLDHPNLSLFRAFGGGCDNENNFTRALLIALTRSPWSPVLLRGFFDLLSDKLRSVPNAAPWLPYLSSWPTCIEVSMQQGTAGETFLPNDSSGAVLVDLIPDPRARPCGGEVGEESGDSRGIVDAMITVRGSGGTDERSISVVIESKLYGGVEERQRALYRRAIEKRLGQRPAEVAVSWDEVYRLTEHLPSEADADPIVSDFKTFIASRPHLLGFTGFAINDFRNPAVVDGRLLRLCERVAGSDPFIGQVQRKHRGLDYDLPVNKQAALLGNVGVACWDSTTLSCKLVTGAGSQWQTTRLFKCSGSSNVGGVLHQLAATGRLRLVVQVRLYFHRFDVEWIDVATLDVPPADAGVLWAEAVGVARSFHQKRADDEVLDALAQRMGGGRSDGIDRARAARIEKRPKCFAVVVAVLQTAGRDLAAKPADAQVEAVQRDLGLLVTMLQAVSADPAET
jgi:hypothetical protein